MERIRLSAKPTKPARMTLVILAIGAALVLGACRQQALLAPQPVGQPETVLMSLSLDSAAAAAHGVSRAAGPSDGGSSLRTILPATQSLGSLVYYISGTSTNSSQTLPVQQVTATVNAANASGTVSVALDRSVSWDLTLWACSAGATGYTTATQLDSNAVLKGRSYANLGTGGSAHFVLGTAGLTRQGTINLTVYGAQGFPKPGYTGQSTNTTIFLVELWQHGATSRYNQFSNQPFYVEGGNNTNAANKLTWTGQLPPGVWYLEITFRWPNESETYHYTSEEFVISPGIATTVDLAIPNFIGTIPTAPTNFYAAHGNEEEEGLFVDQYLLYLSWQHTQSNHNGYQLEFCELAYTRNDFPSSIDTDAEWNQYTAGGKFFSYNSTSFAGSRWRNTGGLGPADRQCTLWMDMGKRYLFRIRAANGDGSSNWVYLSNLGLARNPDGSYPASAVWPAGVTPNKPARFPENTYNGQSGLFPGWTVNRAAIHYDIGPYGFRNLTRFKRSGKDLYNGSQYVRDFYSQGRNGATIKIEDYHDAQDGSTLVVRYPRNGSNSTYLSKWHFWNGVILLPNGTRSSGNWDGYQNLYLYASWESDQATNALEYLPQRSWIRFNNRLLSADTFTPTSPDDVQTVTLSKATVTGTVPLAIVLPASGKVKDDGYTHYAKGTVRIQNNNTYGIMYGKAQSLGTWGTTNNFNIDGIADWGPGSYRVMVELKTGGYWVYRYYFDINLTP